MKDRIIAQLEAAESRIKELEGKLEVLQRGVYGQSRMSTEPSRMRDSTHLVPTITR
jgi:hypothetical protein